MLLDMVGFTMIIPDIATRARSFGSPEWLIGTMLSSMFVVQFVVSPRWGVLADRAGRRNVMVGCTLISALAMLVYAFADSMPWLFASRILAGLGAANVAVGMAYITTTVAEEKKAQALGHASGAMQIGMVIGPALGGFTAKLGGNFWVGMIGGVLSLVGAVAAWKLVPKDTVDRAENSAAKSERVGALVALKQTPALIPLMVLASIAWFSLASLEGTFAQLLRDVWGYQEQVFGMIFSFESALTILTQLFLLGWIAKRLSPKSTLVLAYLLQGLGLLLFPFAPSMIFLFVISAIYAPGSAMANPTLNNVCSEIAPKELHASLFGIMQSARSFGFIAGPTLGNWLYGHSNRLPYLLAGGICAFAAIFVLTNRSIGNSLKQVQSPGPA